MSDHTKKIQRNKGDTSTITNPSLASSSTPTLANANHSLSLPPTTALPEPSVQALSNQQDTQSNNEQLPEREAFKQEPLGHDISRISLRPQSKLSTGQSSDPSEPEANWVADRIMQMPEPGNFADQMPETRFRGKKWNRFYQALDKHENGHISIDERAFTNLHKKLLGKSESSAETIFNNTFQKANTDNDKYDSDTQHGLTQGTSVNQVQCGVEKLSESETSPLENGDRTSDIPNTDSTTLMAKRTSQPSSVSQSQGHDLRKISMLPVRAKLTVSQSGDPYEQEADRVANEVMRMQIPESNEAVAMRSLRDTIHRKCAVCEEEYLVQPKSMLQRSGDSTLKTEGDIESRLNSSKGGGNPLPDEVRSFMEPRFGSDFSGVQVHTDSNAVQMNRQLNAQAFAHRNDIYFGAGKSPGNNELTAHELTHVVQQVGKVQAKIDGSSGNPVDPPQSKDDKPQVPPTDLAEPPKTVPSNTPLPQQPDLVVPEADKSIDLPATAGNGKDSPTLSAPPSTTASNVSLPQEPQPNMLGGSVAEKPVQSLENTDATASPAIKAPDVPDLSQSTLPDATGTPPTLPESPILAATAQQILQTAEIEKTAFSQQVQSHRSSLQNDSIATAQNIESTTQSKIQATVAAIDSRKAEVLSSFVSTRASITTEMDSQKAVAHADGEKALEALRKQGEDKRQAAMKAAEEPASQAEKNGEIEAERVRKSSSETIGRINAIAQQKAQGQGSTPEERKAAREATMSAAAEVVNKIRSNAEELVQGAIQAAQKTAQTLRGEGKKLADSLGGSTTQVEQSIQQGVTSTINAIQTAGNQRLQSLDTLQAQALASLEQLKGQVIPALQQSGQQAQQAAQQLGQMMVGQIDVAEAQSLQQFDQGVTGAIDQLHQADGQPHLDPAALQGAGQQVSKPFRQGRLQLEAMLGEQVAEMGGQLGKLETSFATEIEAASQKFQTSTNQVLSSTNSGLSQMQSDTTKLFTDTLATGRDAAQQAVQQYGDGLQQKIDETKQGWNKAKDQSQTDIRTQVDKGLSSHAEMETKAPGDFEKAAKDAVDNAQGSIWSGIGKGLLSVLKGLAIFAIVVVGIAAIIAVAFGVAFGWPLILAVAAVVGIIFLVYAFGSRLVVRYKELVSVLPKDTPWYAQFLLGMALPFIALGDVIGVVPIYEGIIGENAITGKKFTKEERAEKITEGVLTLVLIFLAEKFAKGAGKTGEPAIDPNLNPEVKPGEGEVKPGEVKPGEPGKVKPVEPGVGAKRTTVDGHHEITVNKEIIRCSPNCGVIQDAYPNELKQRPDLQERLTKAKGKAETDPEAAAEEAKQIDADLAAVRRENLTKAKAESRATIKEVEKLLNDKENTEKLSGEDKGSFGEQQRQLEKARNEADESANGAKGDPDLEGLALEEFERINKKAKELESDIQKKLKESNQTINLPSSWGEIKPDTVFQTADGRKVSFGKEQIQLGERFDSQGKHLRAIEKGQVPPRGNNGLVPSEEPGFDLKSKVLGQGGDQRFHGKSQDGVLNFPGKMTDH
ncbi:DUF4157 domain-containing protein [Nostoc sp. XA010]|uniref:eCIS core domain-containing protein n=1 Tax=Nostoc sp. XA010 TaxID=2780407 RepID=UPI001E2B15B5|nr:DUF4157 domain-containing protein [Nostoc sp. XA010]MCC5659031.1 DUF4157 domain-containing protein [Nostoc sp. XA010]